ncbi:cAMP-regulated phosphoprotein 21 isoform X1 [Poecilia latipinna]|uniref:cAMP-regulated phosphoprotein 21 isoform X1 n=1 Tax=Poecilia latipinna TaxID=48699 RepID=UPI00072E6A34|nr:PREDICTED: cAMP-regulated phosphoprotein 21-like isoform X1 [Poecilia latipinna]XP_014913315.1 PREDICTED: cAMP-regulated phosphoprotein 21-like isoform X1 [Poecilia latipinna]XP_014913317.1 PREDICTED: cAMP-regulated phosphoprotein 21-like isoform X1 [Poecilia latipinna]
MTEAVVESADVLAKPCDTKSHPSLSPCLPLCSQKGGGECHTDIKKLQQQEHCNQVIPKKKFKPKGKLVRSMAFSEESSPFEETKVSPDTNIPSSCHDNERTSSRDEEQENSPDPKKPPLSKESSVEYTDSTGTDLDQFIEDTLNSNPRDRLTLLKLEQDMTDFIFSNSSFKKFPQMSSYHRMLVHRVAAYFGMEHNVDHTGKSVIINRTSNTRIPEQRFSDMVHKDKTEDTFPLKILLKRDNSDDQGRHHPSRERQSKSMEEREEEYQRARERIFNKEVRERDREELNGTRQKKKKRKKKKEKEWTGVNFSSFFLSLQPLCTQESGHAESRDVEEYNSYVETQRKRQLFRKSRANSSSSWTGSSKQSSIETDYCYSNDPPPWSSTDSDSSFQWTSQAMKAHQPSGQSWDTRSGSISLYRLPPPCAHPSPPPPIIEEPVHTYVAENGIPPGSILVNPLTGQPFLNPDGSPAVYNPPDSQQPISSQTLPPQQQVVQYSSVSYSAPQMLPVTPSQPYSTVEDLSSQFAHVTVSCPSTGDAAPIYPPSQGYIYAAPAPPNLPSFCQPSPQVPVYVYPTSAQPGFRPASPSQHVRSSAAQPAAGYPPAVRVQQSSHTQPQPVLGTYTPVASHQCSMVQGGTSVPFPQSKAGPGGVGDVGYCCVVPPPPHHSSCTNLRAPAWNMQY